MLWCCVVKKCYILLDLVYNSCLVYMIMNCLMKDGKKVLVYKLIY